MAQILEDYVERVYAGVLGKLIGVYVGRPFEGWTHQKILEELGPIHHYVHDKLDLPLVVTDDDVSGTFTFIRALADNGCTPDISSEAIGKTWLNYVIDRRTIFWWGGRGISTEHTAFSNLKRGIAAPMSGSMQANGKTVAEQIGAQIFIDGWALVSPGNPSLAARLAEAAARVSHDGEAVYAAKLWAAMEAEAFLSKDVDHLLDVGLGCIPADSLITQLIGDIRAWTKVDNDWQKTRQRIEDKYGYDKFCGICHVVPNHGIMIMTLIYAGHNFHEAMHIINTCGWDTDCNSGNVGCLVAIMNGLPAFENGPDWRGPLADRALISSADGGYSINSAARITYDIASLGCRLARHMPPAPPKGGAQFHFTLPGSVQGFQASGNSSSSPEVVRVRQAVDELYGPALAIELNGLSPGAQAVEVLTPTFAPLEADTTRHYYLAVSPLVYPGQHISATIRAAGFNTAAVKVSLRLKVYTPEDQLADVDGEAIELEPSQRRTLEWTIPETFGSQPIQSIGLVVAAAGATLDGIVWLDNLRYSGTPTVTLKPVSYGPKKANSFWIRSFVSGADNFHTWHKLRVAQDRGEGIVTYGTRQWRDYRIIVHGFTINLLQRTGVAVRIQGLNRYYAIEFIEGDRLAIVKALDEKRTVLSSVHFAWKLDTPYEIEVTVFEDSIAGTVRESGNQATVRFDDSQYLEGGIGLVVTESSISVDSIEIAPVPRDDSYDLVL